MPIALEPVLPLALLDHAQVRYAYPDKVAAAMALCSGCSLKDMSGLGTVPLWIMHGTADRIVPYSSIAILKNYFVGSAGIAIRLADIEANYQIYRYKGAGHEISVSMRRTLPEQLRFLEENVVKGVYRPLDATLTDPLIEDQGWRKYTVLDLYSRK